MVSTQLKKYARQIGSFPQARVRIKIDSNHHLVTFLYMLWVALTFSRWLLGSPLANHIVHLNKSHEFNIGRDGKCVAPPKTHMESENTTLEKEKYVCTNHHFLVPYLLHDGYTRHQPTPHLQWTINKSFSQNPQPAWLWNYLGWDTLVFIYLGAYSEVQNINGIPNANPASAHLLLTLPCLYGSKKYF